MNVRPLHDQIIVNRLTEGEQKIGGIIIPDSAKEKPQQGTVMAAGSGKAHNGGKRVPLDVKAGDRILFGKYSGQEIKLDGKDYFIMKEDDVLAVNRRPRERIDPALLLHFAHDVPLPASLLSEGQAPPVGTQPGKAVLAGCVGRGELLAGEVLRNGKAK